eukprot:14930946-Alexandrium_andersonii.AAC.1
MSCAPRRLGPSSAPDSKRRKGFNNSAPAIATLLARLGGREDTRAAVAAAARRRSRSSSSAAVKYSAGAGAAAEA